MIREIKLNLAPRQIYSQQVVEAVFRRDQGVCLACGSRRYPYCVELELPIRVSAEERIITLCLACYDRAEKGLPIAYEESNKLFPLIVTGELKNVGGMSKIFVQSWTIVDSRGMSSPSNKNVKRIVQGFDLGEEVE